MPPLCPWICFCRNNGRGVLETASLQCSMNFGPILPAASDENVRCNSKNRRFFGENSGPIAVLTVLDHSSRLFACVRCKIDACFLGKESTYNDHLQGAFLLPLAPSSVPLWRLALIGTSKQTQPDLLGSGFFVAWTQAFPHQARSNALRCATVSGAEVRGKSTSRSFDCSADDADGRHVPRCICVIGSWSTDVVQDDRM